MYSGVYIKLFKDKSLSIQAVCRLGCLIVSFSVAVGDVFTCTLREYAEMIRGRVTNIGLVVDMIQLSPTVSLADALDAAANRGLLYALIVTSQHELHHSVTLTILHGRNPQGIFLMTGKSLLCRWSLCTEVIINLQ